jgi:hypothetical protein
VFDLFNERRLAGGKVAELQGAGLQSWRVAELQGKDGGDGSTVCEAVLDGKRPLGNPAKVIKTSGT